MIDQTIIDKVNHQIQHELSNAYIYKGISLYFKGEDLNGFAAWFYKQSGEEEIHAQKLIDHLIDRGATPVLAPLPAAKTTFDSPAAAVDLTFNLERSTTEYINKLYEAALEAKDYPLQILLQWYINEQVEEEQWTAELQRQLKGPHGFCGSQIFFLNKVWGKRAAGE